MVKRMINRIIEVFTEDTSKLSVSERLERLEDMHQAIFLLQIIHSVILIKLILGI